MKTASSTFSIKSITSDNIITLSKEWREPQWVTDLRLQAFKNFEAQPWPDLKNEKWKRTHPESIAWDKLNLFTSEIKPLTSEADLSALFQDYRNGDGNSVPTARAYTDLAGGRYQKLPDFFKDQNIKWISLEEAIQSESDKIKEGWSYAVEKAKNNKFLSLNLALGNNGSVLILPKGSLVKTPFQSFVGAGSESDAKFLLNFIFLEEAAQADIWEELIGVPDTNPRFVSSYTHVQLKQNAKVSCYYLQHWDNNTSHFQFQDVVQHAFSKFNAIAIGIGGSVFHNEVQIELKGQGAENKVLGVLFGDEKQNFVNWITQNHMAPKTTSDIQYRGALKGHSKSFFSGMVFIDKPAQQSDAYQSAKSLLLSQDAKADSIPNLEILADDVKCSHGAAVGPVDEDQKYYLATRGISSEKAEEIIIQGFFEPVLSEVPSPLIQDRLRNFIEEKIHQ